MKKRRIKIKIKTRVVAAAAAVPLKEICILIIGWQLEKDEMRKRKGTALDL